MHMHMHALAPRVLFGDDFRTGLDARRWELRPTHASPRGDGLVSRTGEGITVIPTAVHPVSGDPSFVQPHEPEPSNAFLRWIAVARATAPTGVPGFHVHDGEDLAGSAEFAVERYGTDDIADPVNDVRQGAGAMLAFDRETSMVFDVAVTGSTAYAIYERLPAQGKHHRAFSCVLRLADVLPGAYHRYTIRLNQREGAVHWLVDGRRALTVTNLGRPRFPASCMLWDIPGEEEDVVPRQLAFGLSMIANTLSGQGVRLSAKSLTVTSEIASDSRSWSNP